MPRLCKARIGMYNYDIFTNDDGGSGRGSTVPGNGKCPQIVIGIAQDWDVTLSVCLHEIIETLFVQYHVRLARLDEPRADTGQVMFLFDHAQFSGIMADTAYALSIIEPHLRKIQNAKK